MMNGKKKEELQPKKLSIGRGVKTRLADYADEHPDKVRMIWKPDRNATVQIEDGKIPKDAA